MSDKDDVGKITHEQSTATKSNNVHSQSLVGCTKEGQGEGGPVGALLSLGEWERFLTLPEQAHPTTRASQFPTILEIIT